MKRTTLGCAVERLRVCTKGAATPDRRNERRSTGIEIHGNATGATDSGGMQRGLGCRSKSVPMSGDAAGRSAWATLYHKTPGGGRHPRLADCRRLPHKVRAPGVAAVADFSFETAGRAHDLDIGSSANRCIQVDAGAVARLAAFLSHKPAGAERDRIGSYPRRC